MIQAMGVCLNPLADQGIHGELALNFCDMEAGIEHFGRGIDEGVDKLVIVVEPLLESFTIAVKIRDLALNMKKEVYALLNKVRSNDVAEKLTEKLNNRGIKIIGVIPDDPGIFDAGLKKVITKKSAEL